KSICKLRQNDLIKTTALVDIFCPASGLRSRRFVRQNIFLKKGEKTGGARLIFCPKLQSAHKITKIFNTEKAKFSQESVA
ncbi:MAG: hypothetical protein IJW12_04945, partial [Opitutales bacterium]|nr:hypothetical protein [Opitutales bacterium]